ncbi:non-ribosomal peptide synthetase, partial [Cesiribacter sp. SM1]|uniref:non-ribosomal peptide synthetase n=1 Tax=Cesiribacter sp. SM1 TaxID=2861196 RepID=UPI001CD588DF
MESANFLKWSNSHSTLIPLHPAQHEVYYDQIVNINSSHYNLGGYIVLKGQLNKAKLREVLEGLPLAFDVLRLRFDFTDHEPCCTFLEKGEVLTTLELDFSSSPNPQVDALEWMQSQFNKTFSLKGQLFEHALLTISDEEHWLYGRYHHLITDGYGFTICCQHIAQSYSMLAAAGAVSDHPKYHFYEQEVIKAHDYIGSESYQKDALYWKSQFKELPEPLLKQRYRLAHSEDIQSKTKVIEITDHQAQLINSLVSKSGINISLQQLTLAALSIYFARTENRQEIVFGVPVHNRRNKFQRQTMGMFAGMVPFKGFYDPELRLADFLQVVKLQQRNDYRHQGYPISHLNRELKLMSTGRSQIFDVAVNYAFLDFEVSFAGLDAKTFDMASQSEKYPLHFWWRDYGKQQPLQLRIDYHLAYFSEEEIEHIGQHLLFILEQFPDALDKRLGDIELVPEQEQQYLLGLSNPAAIPFPEDRTLIDLFEEQLFQNPDATAVVFRGERLTYRELNNSANQLAHYLQQKGIKEESLLPLCVDRSLEMIIGLLGILKAGAAYVPIDPAYPGERINYMLRDTAARVVLCTTATRELFTEAKDLVLVLLDEDWHKIAAESTEKPLNKLSPTNLAYVIYTSGTSGKPKGVLVEHRSVVNLIHHQTKVFGIRADEKILQLSNYAFDASIEQIFLALCNGAALVVLPKEALLDSAKLLQLISEQEITHLHATPSFLKQLTPGRYRRLKRVIAGGEACPESLATTWEDFVQFYNEYGPTETTITATEYAWPSKNYGDEKLVPIGRPVANTRVYVLDSEGKLVPKGASGELCIGGVQVARGYLNRPDLTAEKFVDNRFSKDREERLYKTGDLVRWLPDGNLEYLGRLDDQVKIRGYRIEIAEVEGALNQCRGVKESVVLAKTEASGNKRLLGYVVPEKAFDRDDIISQLKQVLPEYMIPSLIIEIKEIPLTWNGKVDKRALPEDDACIDLRNRYVAPRNDTEEQLVAIWQELLGLGHIGVEDNFFELGGHSLLATRLLSILRNRFQLELQVKDIFAHPTIASLAGELLLKGRGNVLPSIVPANRTGRLPLSFSQERLWFIDQLQGSTHYHLPAVYRLRGNLNKEALSAAFRQIISRHEVLRTVIRQEEGKGYQQVLDIDWQLTTRDGSAFADANTLERFIQSYIQAPFNLSNDCMLRAMLVELSEQENLLVIVLHHIASDGWSVPVLARELVRLYKAGGSAGAAALAPLAVQYGDYALWQRKHLQDLQEEQLTYWKQKLKGLEALELPTDFARPAVKSNAGGMVSLKLDRKLVQELELFSKKEEVTLFMSLLSAFKVLLYRYSGQTDVCVGSPIAGRRLPELEAMIGFFVNSLALRTQIRPDQNYYSLLQEVKATTLEAFEQQDVPFEKVVEAMGVIRDMSRSPLFQVMFSMQNTPAEPLIQLGNVSCTRESLESHTAKFDLSFTAVVNKDEIEISAEFSKDLFTAETVQRMLGHYQLLLSHLLQNPLLSVSQLELVTEQEKEQLTEGYNATAAAYPQDKTLVELFSAQAAKTPDAVAVADLSASLTYKELDERSNQLAHYLQRRGVTAETLVPLCLDRSLELVVAQLGVLKAGGAYVPIDPSYPRQRIHYMLQDTAAHLVLSASAYEELLETETASGTKATAILLDKQWQEISRESAATPAVALDPANLAYVIYTSGSTGNPKGVLVEHRGVVNLCSWHIRTYGLGPCCRSTMMAGVGFDASVWEVWPVLLSGAGLYVVSDQQRLQAEELLHFYQRRGITHSFVPTALVEGLLKLEQPQNLELQWVLTGGDQLRQVSTAHLCWKLVNHYGPTENTVVATAYELTAKEAGLPPIGRPISNTRAYVVDKAGSLVPQGVAGELCLGGVQVARGYLNLPELTGEKFVQDPFCSDAGARMYKTGDLVRWRGDGELEYLGRIDDQVKIRGYRIELGEVESVLSQC